MIRVGNVLIGSGRPKIFASITEEDRKSVIAAADILLQKRIDVIEWRIDFYRQADDWEMVQETVQRLKRSLCGKPLLVTFRTAAEGGEREIDNENYRLLLENLARSGFVDLIDVEIFKEISLDMFTGDLSSDRELLFKEGSHEVAFAGLKSWINRLKEDVVVVGSYHNFERTPDDAELEQRMRIIVESGADIPKLAVMPQNRMDVLRLMTFTLKAQEQLDMPLITMSMGKLGSISRVSGEAFGSAVTFGSIGQESAPGQLPVNRLDEMLDMVHQNYQ